MNNTKNNHFVPQGYLKNFLNDNLSLYKYDLNNSLKSYEVTNLKSVLVKIYIQQNKKLHMKKCNLSVY